MSRLKYAVFAVTIAAALFQALLRRRLLESLADDDASLAEVLDDGGA